MHIPDNIRGALEAGGDLACFALEVNDLAAMVIKATDADLKLWRGDRPVGLQPILYKGDTGAVLALVVTIFEPGGNRFAAESTLNVAEPAELELLQQLSRQREYHVHFFDGRNEYTFSKSLPYRSNARAELTGLIRQAVRHNETCAWHDWAQAKVDYFAATAGRWA